MNSHESAQEQAGRKRSVKVGLVLDSIAEFDSHDREYFRAFALSQVALQVAIGQNVLTQQELTSTTPEALEPETIDYDMFKELVADFPHMYPNDTPQFKNLVTRAWNAFGGHLNGIRRWGTVPDLTDATFDLKLIKRTDIDHRDIRKMGPMSEELWRHALAKLGAKGQD